MFSKIEAKPKTVFIPITVTSSNRLKNEDNVFFINPLQQYLISPTIFDRRPGAPVFDKDNFCTKDEYFHSFTKDFDFPQLATILTNMSKRYSVQVGKTKDEAMDIVNQKTHFEYKLLVEVVSPPSLSEVSSKPFLNPEEGKIYDVTYWLLKNTTFTAEQIISIAPMQPYDNTCSFLDPNDNPGTYWPQTFSPHKLMPIHTRHYKTISNSNVTLDSKLNLSQSYISGIGGFFSGIKAMLRPEPKVCLSESHSIRPE